MHLEQWKAFFRIYKIMNFYTNKYIHKVHKVQLFGTIIYLQRALAKTKGSLLLLGLMIR